MYIIYCMCSRSIEDPLAPAGESLARQIPVSWVCVCVCVLCIFRSLPAAYKTHGATTTKCCNVMCARVWYYGFLLRWEKHHKVLIYPLLLQDAYGAFVLLWGCVIYPHVIFVRTRKRCYYCIILLLLLYILYCTHSVTRWRPLQSGRRQHYDNNISILLGSRLCHTFHNIMY